MYDATALAKIVFRSEVPIEAPSCWPTLTVADATPASCGATPKMPVLIAGATTRPRPSPASTSGPSTPSTELVCAPSWASQAIAPAAMTNPAVTTGRGPTLGIRTIVDRLAAAARQTELGKNAKPVTIGE